MAYETLSDDELPGVKGMIDHLTHGGGVALTEVYSNGDGLLVQDVPEDVLARALAEFVQKEKAARAANADTPPSVL